MPLTLVTGRANVGKTGVLFDVVRTAVARGRQLTVVLPSRPEAVRTAREFALGGPFLGVKVTTFDEHLAALWGLFGDGKRIVGRTQRRVLLSRAIDSVRLRELAASAHRPGFVGVLESLASGVTAIGGQPPEHEAPTEGVGAELAAIMGAYVASLDATGLVEPSLATEVLRREVGRECFQEELVANRFTGLTPTQERLLVAHGRYSDAWLSLPWEEGFLATAALDGLVGRLVQGGAIVHPVPFVSHTHSAELLWLESHLFLPPREALGAPTLGDVRVSQAYGEEAEAARIAAEIQEAVGAGVPPSRVAVVYFDPPQHVRALRRALAEASIPAEFDVLEPAARTGFGRALVHLVGFARAGMRSDLVAFARLPHSGVARQSADKAEASWRQGRVTRAGDLLADVGRLGGEAPRVIRLAVRLCSQPVSAQTAAEWQNLADYLLRNGAKRLAARAGTDLAADAAAHRAFLRGVGELAAMPGGGISAEQMMQAFGAERVAPLDAEPQDCVQVLSAQRARSRRFDAVIVGGLALGDFPPRRSEDPLASGAVREALRSFGIELERADDQAAHRLLFYLVASRASKRLVLSRQVADADGRALRASWLLEELLDLYRPPGVKPGDGAPLPTLTLSFSGGSHEGTAPVSRRRALREQASSVASVRPRGRQAAIRDPELLADLASRQVFSVTELESYLRCPYAWFYERVVSPRPLGEEVDALLAGRLIHTSLERFYRLLPQTAGTVRVTPATVERAVVLAGTVVHEVLASEPAPQTLAEEAAFAHVRAAVEGFVTVEARFLPGFAPAWLEWPFDTRETPVAVLEGFDLRGRIDRIDRDEDGRLVITDYKSGAVCSDHGRGNFEKLGRVQLPLYAAVAEATLGAEVVGAFYRRVGADNLRKKANRGFFDPALVDGSLLTRTDAADPGCRQQLVREAVLRAAEAVAGIRAGEIAPQPAYPKVCAYCRCGGFCGRAVR